MMKCVLRVGLQLRQETPPKVVGDFRLLGENMLVEI